MTLTVTRDGATEMSQSYAYDKLNRLTSVSENGQVIATYTYDNKGNRIQTVSSGETTNYTYNLANMLTSQVTGEKLSEAYTYYLNGNQKTKVSNGETTTYTYDGMNRLVSENDTLYTFDDFGNRATMTDGEVTTSYTYDLNNRLLSSVEVNGDITTTEQYFYDNNGNQISKVVSATHPSGIMGEGDYSVSDVTDDYVALYEYNCYNQLVYANTDGVISTYTYAPDGLRASKTVGDIVTMFVYDSANIIEEIVGDDTNKYYRGIGIIKNGDGLYYLYNGQGDVAMLTNADGAVVASYTFDAYGNAQQENTVYNPFGYRGEYYDTETDFIYLRARYYDPTTGRFINEDPIRDGLNWYVYCGNNPVNYIDPWGLEALLDEYINKNYAGQANVAVLINRPVPNSRDVGTIENGEIKNGHAFIRLDDGDGNVKYVGFAAVTSNDLEKIVMMLGVSVEGSLRDDSNYDWHVGKIYTLTYQQYGFISDYISNIEAKNPKYNMQTYNCVNFVVEAVERGGITNAAPLRINKHTWTLPDNLGQQLSTYKGKLGKLPPIISVPLVNGTLGDFYGFTPADAAQDMKNSIGITLLKYDGVIRTSTNYMYYKAK